MILDTSALMVLILDEPEASHFARTIEGARVRRMSAVSYVETAIVIERRADQVGRAMLDSFIADLSIRIEPVTVEQALLARQAFVLFGKGRHEAGLNFGDCFSYALAKTHREPLLFKGNDFGHTDLEVAG